MQHGRLQYTAIIINRTGDFLVLMNTYPKVAKHLQSRDIYCLTFYHLYLVPIQMIASRLYRVFQPSGDRTMYTQRYYHLTLFPTVSMQNVKEVIFMQIKKLPGRLEYKHSIVCTVFMGRQKYNLNVFYRLVSNVSALVTRQ